MNDVKLNKFLAESNKIERIFSVSDGERVVAKKFLSLSTITIDDLNEFVRATQPDAILRDKRGLNVRVGKHLPPAGGLEIRSELKALLNKINSGEISAYEAHLEYENLHPFTDGNGRSGRILWLWQMGSAPLGFLHKFYYQTLDSPRRK